MAGFVRFEDISAWQQGRSLVNEVYSLSRSGLFAKDYGLREQMQRAAVSICSNIAEGFERRGNKEFIKFLWIAKGSAAEVASQLYHAKDLGYVTDEQFEKLYADSKKIGATIHRLITSIHNPNRLKLGYFSLLGLADSLNQ